ncbi:MAG: hypothetical protein ACAI25_01965, partial [Planctomycetota bacterium]
MKSQSLRAFAAVGVVLVLGASAVRADDYAQIEKAKELISNADRWAVIACFDKTEQSLVAAEKELASVDETGKAGEVAKIKELREKMVERQRFWDRDRDMWVKNIERQITSDEDVAMRSRGRAECFEKSDAQLADSWIKSHLDAKVLEELHKKQAWSKKKTLQAGMADEAERATGQIGRLMSGVDDCVESAKTTTDNAYLKKNFAEQVKNVEGVVTEHETALGAEKVAEYRKHLATAKTEFEKNVGDAMLADLARIQGMVQDVLDGKRQWTESQMEGWFKDAEARAATCPQGDKRTADGKARSAKQKTDFATMVAGEARDSLVKPVLSSWQSCQEYGKECEGWEQENTPNSLKIYVNNSPARLGCDKTEKLLSEVVQRFFNNDHVAEAQKKYPNDAELKKVIDEASALREKASAKILKFMGSILDEAEKVSDPAERKNVQQMFYNMKNLIERTAKGSSGAAAAIARIDALD